MVTNILSCTYHKTRHTRYHAIKLNRLKDKQGRNESEHSFLIRTDAKIVPKSLLIDLEPTVGNHDQGFLDDWYDQLFKINVLIFNNGNYPFLL